MASTSDRPVSARARRTWTRLCEFYGSRLTDQFGMTCPESWADAFNRAPDADLKRMLVAVRAKHLHHPPTLPEVEDILRPRVAVNGARSIPEQLTAEVVRRFWSALSNWQRVSRWNFIGETYPGVDRAGNARTEYTIVGVVVPQDPADPARYPSVRVQTRDVVPALQAAS